MRDIITNVHTSSRTVPVIIARLLIKISFSQQIFEKYKYFIKIRPVGAELFRADRQTDMTKLVALRSFANAPEMSDATNLITNTVLK